jgi:hypothetical protein
MNDVERNMTINWIVTITIGLLVALVIGVFVGFHAAKLRPHRIVGVDGGGGGKQLMPNNWTIQLNMDPGVAGQCQQQAKVNAGPMTNYPTFVPVKQGDHIQWTTTSAAAGNSVFFPQVGSPDFPGSPMFSKNWVFVFAYGNDSLVTAARLTQAEQPWQDFQYSQVLVPDANGQLVPCKYPNPIQGMGVHVDN